MHKDLQEILISEAELREGVRKLGERISSDYAGRCITMVGVLKGSVFFLTDLARAVSNDVRLDFMMVSSYSGEHSTGVVRIMLDLKESIEGSDVLIVEDIIDSGLTMDYLLQNLRTRRPRTLEVCALLEKPSRRRAQVPVKYSGFSIPDKFVVGYGLDYNGLYRNLPYIGVMRQEITEGNKTCR